MRRNPATSSRRPPCRCRECCPNQVPCTRLSLSEGKRPGARRDSGGTSQGRRGRPRGRRVRTAWWVVSTVGHPWEEDVSAGYKYRFGNTHAPFCDGIDESVARSRFRPRRFAPARTPSKAVMRLVWCSHCKFVELTGRIGDDGVKEAATSPRISCDVERAQVQNALSDSILGRSAQYTWFCLYK
jgi:hypothetical protein